MKIVAQGVRRLQPLEHSRVVQSHIPPEIGDTNPLPGSVPTLMASLPVDPQGAAQSDLLLHESLPRSRPVIIRQAADNITRQPRGLKLPGLCLIYPHQSFSPLYVGKAHHFTADGLMHPRYINFSRPAQQGVGVRTGEVHGTFIRGCRLAEVMDGDIPT